MNERKYKFETIQVHAGQETADKSTDSRAVPIYQTSSYVFKDSAQGAARFALKEPGNIYGRLTNPTEDIFEKRIAALEGGVAAVATASGAAAITYAVLNISQQGDNIVSASSLYGGTYNLFKHTLPRYGITTKFVKEDDLESFKKAIDSKTKAIYIETLGNPNCNIIDVDEVAKIAHEHKIPLIVDNTFATPYLFRPIEHGADIVVHSATKFIGGHGTSIGGVIIDSGKFDWFSSEKFLQLSKEDPSYHGFVFAKDAAPAGFAVRVRAILLRDTGATISPFNSFLFLQGLETLSLRVERHVYNALKVVEFLNNNDKVEKVNHPSLPNSKYNKLYKKYFKNGAGSIFTFEIKGGSKEAQKFINKLKIFSLLANVADVKSLVIHPASTTHAQLTKKQLIETGIKENTIRLSIGTENIDDIIYDLNNAFKD
ncbi:O-acetylhomoserine aminocarboxypropyltransferase/cysteine synthase family protein [Clostridium sp. BJN0001]|uniref:O-acetylhomoserine aminocarboxypropyltransferase/cysteine synthase family protein n=1 Tax=Clostridium sp. BJN0001 TaxID=2930219 RepID=UPI001FD1BAA1|nr:O-acetylhomoserine aminocarboxypropyltransferase/cysteine synthase family protein [Clostridium sp. BJN0001]